MRKTILAILIGLTALAAAACDNSPGSTLEPGLESPSDMLESPSDMLESPSDMLESPSDTVASPSAS